MQERKCSALKLVRQTIRMSIEALNYPEAQREERHFVLDLRLNKDHIVGAGLAFFHYFGLESILDVKIVNIIVCEQAFALGFKLH